LTQLQGQLQEAISVANSLGDARIFENRLLFPSFGKVGTRSSAIKKLCVALDFDRSLSKMLDAF